MTAYRLYDGASARVLSEHRTIEDAYAAADDHSLAVLVEAGDWVTVEHLIAWVSRDGRVELASEITHVGPPEDVEACRLWLEALPGRRHGRL